jgi:hypothetical protein
MVFSEVAPVLFGKALKTTKQRTKTLVADSQFSSKKLREQLATHGVRAVIPYPANQGKGEARPLRVDKFFRTHGAVGERQVYAQRGLLRG